MARILFVTQTAHPWGGVEVWLEYLSSALAAEHDVTIGLVRGRRFHDPDRYRRARRLQVRTVEVPALTGTREGRVHAVGDAIRRSAAHLVVPVNIADTLEAVRRLKARGDRVRLLYPLHAFSSEYFADVCAFRGIIDFAAGTNRLAERALAEVSGLERERVAYAICGAPAARRAPSFDAARPLRLVFVGRLTQTQKRVRDLVPLCTELARRNVDYALDVAGDGEELPYLRESLAGMPVTFHGVMSREDLYDRVYPGAAAMLILSEWETGPIVAWEAMRNGAALVTTRYLGLRAEGRIVDGENALVASVGDVAALAGAIERLARDASLLERLRRAAFAMADRELSVEASVDAWRNAIDGTLEVPLAMNAAPVPLPKAASRLDALAGVRVAETLRRIFSRGMLHGDPGAEWPHALHAPDARIDAMIAALDS